MPAMEVLRDTQSRSSIGQFSYFCFGSYFTNSDVENVMFHSCAEVWRYSAFSAQKITICSTVRLNNPSTVEKTSYFSS